jgi:hypothetical protein
VGRVDCKASTLVLTEIRDFMTAFDKDTILCLALQPGNIHHGNSFL